MPTSEQMFRLYARIGQIEAQRDIARRERDELARLLEAAADREAKIVGLYGEGRDDMLAMFVEAAEEDGPAIA